jgi:hypothetical protein
MRAIVSLALMLSLTAAGDAFAGKKDKAKDKHDPDAARLSIEVVFGARDLEVVRAFFVESHGRGSCPPGLAKKNNGCLPPGQAKKRYSIGHSLPPGVMPAPLPVELRTRLAPAPSGYFYAMVDGDLVKLAVGTLLVVDAIGGLVN